MAYILNVTHQLWLWFLQTLLAPGPFSTQICLASPFILMCFSVGRLHRLGRAVLISFRVVLTFQSKSTNGVTVASSLAGYFFLLRSASQSFNSSCMKKNYGAVCVIFETLWCDETVLFMTIGAMALSSGIVWKLALVVVPYWLLCCFLGHLKWWIAKGRTAWMPGLAGIKIGLANG